MRKEGQGQKPYSWSLRGRQLDHRPCAIGVRGISIPFAPEWLKSTSWHLGEYGRKGARESLDAPRSRSTSRCLAPSAPQARTHRTR